MIAPTQFRDLVIRPTLEAIGGPQNSEAAVELLLATALHESNLIYLKQINGPALGVYQMEPATHDDHLLWLVEDWRSHKPGEGKRPTPVSWRLSDAELLPNDWDEYPVTGRFSHLLATDLAYATAMARVHYWRVPEALPEAGDAEGMARYYKVYWNTHLGAATIEQFLAAWNQHKEVITGWS